MAAAAPSNSPSASSGATQWAEPASGPGETMESTGYATASSTMPNMPSTAEDAPSASQANIDESTTGAAGPSTGGIKVFQPAPTPQGPATPASDVDEAYFQPTLADVQAHHASVLARNKRLNEAPLLTSKHREEEREGREKRKAEKWPTTTIRIKFSDGTQVQNVFASSSPIQPVYDFVRTCLESSAQSSRFTLWQPPRFTYPEHPPPPDPSKKPKPTPSYRTQIIAPANYGLIKGSTAAGLSGGTGGRETLSELGLVPQSVLMVRWEDEGMNASGYPAPLIPELRQKAEPLPKPQPAESAQTSPAGGSGSNGPSKSGGTGEQKMPKWLAKGLMKKK